MGYLKQIDVIRLRKPCLSGRDDIMAQTVKIADRLRIDILIGE